MVKSHLLQTIFLITVAASQITFGPVDGNFGLTSKHPVLGLVEDLLLRQSPAFLSQPNPRMFKPTAKQICDMFKLERRQRRMCRADKGVAATLLEAVRLSTSECQRLFRYERWNCTIGRYRTKLLRRGFVETSFLHAISAASLTYTFAQACARNNLHSCTCANPQAWKWGGCGDNIRFAARFTRRFLSGIWQNHDIQAEVDRHNSRIGVKVVRQHRRRVCKCHGASGSCSFRTCWTRLESFHQTAQHLKRMFHAAQRVIIDGNDSRHNLLSDKQALVYVNKSPNFCARNAFSAGISGRLCNGSAGCDVMCCGRGYNTRLVTVRRACQCEFIWCCRTVCQTCKIRQEAYVCK